MSDTNETGIDEKYNAWIEANEDDIVNAWMETEECALFADKRCVEDGVYADDVDGVTKWIVKNVRLKHVPNDFIESMYENSFDKDNDDAYDRMRDEKNE